jgi:ABC-type branched-subunit amino acid transport system substrate-binding protein
MGVAALILVAGLIAACASTGGRRELAAGSPQFGPDGQPLPGSDRAPRPTVKVALLLPLSASGNTAKVAQALKQAGELALFDFDNPNVTLIAKDTRGSAEGARAAAAAAVSEGAELIIGPLFSKSVKAAAPVARQANIAMVAFSSDQKVAGNGVYLLSFLPGRDVPRIVDYAVGQGKQRFGALIPQTPYGRIAEQFFRQAVTSRGATIVALERFPPVPPQVDAIFIPTGPESLPTLSALIPYNEIDTSRIQLFGTGRWDYANIGKEKPLVGGWYPAPDPKGWRTFTQRYVKTYEKTPPRLASLAYDAVSLAVTLSSNEPGNRYTAAQLTRSSGFAGVDGLFRLRRDGLTDRGLAILEVQKFDSRVIDPAPSGFNTGPVQAAARQGQ